MVPSAQQRVEQFYRDDNRPLGDRDTYKAIDRPKTWRRPQIEDPAFLAQSDEGGDLKLG